MIRPLILAAALLAIAAPAVAQDEVVKTAPVPAPPLAGGPAPARAAGPPPLVAALIAAGFDPHSKLIGENVQVMFGQRTTLHLVDGKPVLDAVEIGRLDMALPDGTPDTYKPLAPGKLAFAVDSSPQKKQSFLKIWNGLGHAVGYQAELTAIRGGQLARRLAQVCAVPGGSSNYEIWSDPVIAVTLSKIAEIPDDKITCK